MSRRRPRSGACCCLLSPPRPCSVVPASTPLLSLYFHYEIPRATKRERRFLAYQLEYGPNKVRDKHNLAYLNDSVVPMEYTQAQLQQWRDRGIDRIQQLPLCYHPSIEYNLPATPEPSSNALFPGIINGKRRCVRVCVC